MSQPPKIIDMSAPSDEELRPASAPEPFISGEDDEEEEYEEYETPPQQTASASDAARLLEQLSKTLVALYNRYSALHRLAKELNGSSESALIPQSVTVKKVSIVYEDEDGETVTAEVLNVKRVGEIGELLRAEIERLVDNITGHLTKIREISSASEQACNQAKFYTRMTHSKNVPS